MKLYSRAGADVLMVSFVVTIVCLGGRKGWITEERVQGFPEANHAMHETSLSWISTNGNFPHETAGFGEEAGLG